MMTAILPWYARLGFFALAGALVFALGVMYGDEREGQKHIDYIQAQASASVKLMQREQIIVTKTDIKYRDRIKVIFDNGAQIEQTIKDYIAPIPTVNLDLPIGFVRVYNAAWTNTPATAPDKSDADAAGVSLIDVAQADAHNAQACHQWRELAIGWREFYAQLKAGREAR